MKKVRNAEDDAPITGYIRDRTVSGSLSGKTHVLLQLTLLQLKLLQPTQFSL